MAARPAVTLTAEEHATLQRVRGAVQAVASNSGPGVASSAQALAQALAGRCGLFVTVRQGLGTDFYSLRHAFLLVQLSPGQGALDSESAIAILRTQLLCARLVGR